ncbi:hypothetical protein JHK86_040280 [Glycine max]|nr:hypothetical protein JHK86_040280 [Glycine max]
MTVDSLEDMNSESPQASDSNSFSDDENCESNTNEAAMDTEELHIDDEQLKNLTLLEIEKLLHPNQRSLKDYPTMPYPEGGNPASCLENSLILSELNYNNDEARSEFENLFLSMTDGLQNFRKDLKIYESTSINFFACDHHSIFDIHFIPPLERQTCGRQRHSSRKHMWTLQLTQEMLDHPEPLKLPHCTEVPLRACGNHMTILRRHGPPLQWKVEMLNPAIGGKGVVQPWYNFLEKMDFDDGDEISIYYRYYEKIWDIIIRRQEDWEDDDSD